MLIGDQCGLTVIQVRCTTKDSRAWALMESAHLSCELNPLDLLQGMTMRLPSSWQVETSSLKQCLNVESAIIIAINLGKCALATLLR